MEEDLSSPSTLVEGYFKNWGSLILKEEEFGRLFEIKHQEKRTIVETHQPVIEDLYTSSEFE